MSAQASQFPGTNRFEDGSIEDLTILDVKVDFKPMPNPASRDRPSWRIRFDLASDPSRAFGLDLNGEVTLGRGNSSESHIDLSEFGAEEAGVSREHALLRPTGAKLYVTDLGSTNRTQRNGQVIGVRVPFPLNNGDTISFGRLQFVLRIIKRPSGATTSLVQKADLADALVATAKAIASQLELEEVLNQVAESATGLVSAGEISIWLVDQQTGELFLEAQKGIEDERIERLRIPVQKGDSLAAKVVRTGKPIQATRKLGGDQLKVKTDFLVESLLFMPIHLAGQIIGVLMATNREPGQAFTERDERLLGSIVDFAAIAIQNSRTYQITDDALAQRVAELAALNELSEAVTSTLDLATVHATLMDQIIRHWNIEAAGLWLVDPDDMSLHAYVDGSGGHSATSFALGEGIIGKVAAQQGSRKENTVAKAEAYDSKIDTVAGVEARNMAAVPLTVENQTVGVLALFNKRGEGFIEQDIERLEAFARPMATAIDNARLYAEVRHERAIVHATTNILSQPLLILSEEGETIVANDAANEVLASGMSQLFEGLSLGIGQTVEIEINDQTYITTSEHSEGVGTIVIMQDITYVKQLERQRTEFMHALSHDLKSPITSIKGWSHLLQTYGDLNEQNSQFVNSIQKASDRVLEMVIQLLETAITEPGMKRILESCDLSKLVSDAINDLEGAALAKSIELTSKQSGAPHNIQGECTPLYRCILNLIDNAIKYSPEGSQVAVALTYWGETITIQVRDNGPGIPKEDMEHLFERGFRGRMEESDEIGVGLGLATVKGIIEAHGGTITAANSTGGGAEFTITLPTKAV